MFRVTGFGAIALSAVMAIGSAVPAVAQKQDKLTGDQIKRAISGKSGQWVSADRRYSGQTSWAANGQLTGKVNTGSSNEDLTGSWTVRGDQFCEDISIDPESPRCHTVVRASANSYQLIDKDGKLASTLQVR